MVHWYCIYTKPNMEERVSKRLLDQPDIEVFHPKLKRRKYVRGRLEDDIEDLFPSYIFARFGSAKYYHMIKYTRGVRNLVGDTSGNPSIVDDEIRCQVQSRMNDGFVQVEQEAFRRGDRVEIREGPFRGFAGVFQKEVKARDRVMILLNTITYQASVEIEKALLARG